MGTNGSTSKGRKGTTARDLAAAVKLGAIAADAEMVTAAEAAAEIAEAVTAARAEAAAEGAASITYTEHPTGHVCNVVGCRHGAAHGAAIQPDRQLKLACDHCGAVARMTGSALRRASAAVGGADETAGYPRCGDGGTYLPAARRTYTRRTA